MSVHHWRKAAGGLVFSCVLGFAYPGQAQDDALKFFKNYFVTGDYQVGGVGLSGTGVGGIATGAIHFGYGYANEVPEGAEILAAFLYWQVVSTQSEGPDSGADGATFNGVPLTTPTGPIAKVLDTAGTAPCWSSGGGTGNSGGSKRTYTYRADVLRFLPVGNNPDHPDSFGRHLITDEDLQAHDKPFHTIQLPDSGNGNGTPNALGASLVVVYRHPEPPLGPPLPPLNAIVIYDGGYTMANSTPMMTQTIEGFYDPAPVPGKMTHIVGSGQSNKSERLLIDKTVVSINPFQGSQGPDWDNFTFSTPAASGLSLPTSVDTVGIGSGDCLSWGAVIYRTEVRDDDRDGLLNRWESSAATLYDPNGVPLPNLYGIANEFRQDLFIEIGYMETSEPELYGGVEKPEHTHRPTHEVLKMVGDAFKYGRDPDGVQGIAVHFDLGYDYPSGEADDYIIRGDLARGGESMNELATVSCETDPEKPWVCQFAEYPGTVGWKSGFRLFRDALIEDPAPGILPDEDHPCDDPGHDPFGECATVFDRNRKDIFRYALFAHALGVPRDPCVDENGFPDPTFECQAEEAHHVPVSSSGVADFPGGDLLVTLGAFDDVFGRPVGTPYMQASTLMHELGHTFWRRHGGDLGNPNCSPNYLSVMNYLFQLRGLIDMNGNLVIDYSGQTLRALDEGMLKEYAGLGLDPPPPYRTAWYAPQSLFTIGSAATKHCDGSPLLTNENDELIEPPTVRIDGTSVGDAVDWNANGTFEVVNGQDINFDGVPDGMLDGTNDWDTIRLNQQASRRSPGGWFYDGNGNYMGPMSLDAGRADFGRADFGRADFGRADFGRADFGRADFGQGGLGRGDTGLGDLGRADFGRADFGRADFGRADFGRGDFGRADFGQGDVGVGNLGERVGELTYDDVAAQGFTPPNGLIATVRGLEDNCDGLTPAECHRIQLTWSPPNVGSASQYRVFRVDEGSAVRLGADIPSVLGQLQYSVIDPLEHADGEQLDYYVIAVFPDPITGGTMTSGPSYAKVVAVNDPPMAVDDTFVADGPSLDVEASEGVLFNDTDIDSPSLTAALDAPPVNGTVMFNADGSFTYTPNAGFGGEDHFTYTAHDLDPNRSSNVATVSISVESNVVPYVATIQPLKSSAKQGSAVPIVWQLRDGSSGAIVSSLSTLEMLEAVFNGPAPRSGCVASDEGIKHPLYSLPDGSTGNSSFRIVGDSYKFNWDTSTTTGGVGNADKGCWTVLIQLDDGSAPKRTTAVKIK